MGPLFSHAKWTCDLAIKWTQRLKSTGKSLHFSRSAVRVRILSTPRRALPSDTELRARHVVGNLSAFQENTFLEHGIRKQKLWSWSRP